LLHREHSNGFSPVWLCMCDRNPLGEANDFSHLVTTEDFRSMTNFHMVVQSWF
jgi:hypothetical protein